MPADNESAALERAPTAIGGIFGPDVASPRGGKLRGDPAPPPAPGATSWTPAYARASGVYAYALRACSANGCSEPGAQASAYVLRAPTGLTWTPDPVGVNTSYTMKWTALVSATGYRLEEKVGASWQTVYSGASAQFVVDGRAAGNYQYQVSACRDATCGPVSTSVIVPVGGGACNPEPPASISVTPQNSADGQFTVSWAASSSACANSYQLEELYNQTTWQSVPLNDTQIQQRSWSPNPPKTASGTYAYRVYACLGDNCSTYRVGAQVTVSLPVSLATPTNLKACRGTTGSICVWAGSTLELISGATGASYQIRWDAVANAANYQYQLETKDHCDGNWQNHGWQNVNVAYVGGSGNPAGSQCGLDYRYVVKACAGTNCGLATTTAAMVWIQKQPLRPVATEVTYYHTDALGSPVAQTDASGAVVKHTAYRPWGAPADGSYEQGPGYTGHVTDAHTGLSYMQQRYYDPIAGRFLSVDPVAASPESFNRYWYANNNPYRFTDPDGRDSVEEMIDSGAQGCGPVSCVGWATLYSLWTVLGAEGVSQAYDKGWSNAGTEGRIGAAFEVAAALPPVKILKGVPLAYKVAAEGGEHAGFLARQADKSIGQLRKTIRSLEKQISIHEDKIRNPAKYMTRDDPSIPGNIERAVKDWKNDIQRQTKQLDITKEVLNQKSAVCTGTHIVSKC